MLIRESKKNISPEMWALSEKDDVILTKENSPDQRVVVSYKNYKALKKALADQKMSGQESSPAESFDLNPHLQDLIDIVENGQFEDITDDDHYFRNFVKELDSSE